MNEISLLGPPVTASTDATKRQQDLQAMCDNLNMYYRAIAEMLRLGMKGRFGTFEGKEQEMFLPLSRHDIDRLQYEKTLIEGRYQRLRLRIKYYEQELRKLEKATRPRSTKDAKTLFKEPVHIVSAFTPMNWSPEEKKALEKWREIKCDPVLSASSVASVNTKRAGGETAGRPIGTKRMKLYYEGNKEKYAEYSRKRYGKKRKEILEKSKAYYEANKEAIRAKALARYHAKKKWLSTF